MLSVCLSLSVLCSHGSECISVLLGLLGRETVILFDYFQAIFHVFSVKLWRNKCLSLFVSLQRIRVERSGAARGDPDVTAPVPIGAVQCSSLPTAPLLRGQQDQSWGLCVCVYACVHVCVWGHCCGCAVHTHAVHQCTIEWQVHREGRCYVKVCLPAENCTHICANYMWHDEIYLPTEDCKKTTLWMFWQSTDTVGFLWALPMSSLIMTDGATCLRERERQQGKKCCTMKQYNKVRHF